MIDCLRTRVRKQPIIVLYFESEAVLKFYNLEAGLKSCSQKLNLTACEMDDLRNIIIAIHQTPERL